MMSEHKLKQHLLLKSFTSVCLFLAFAVSNSVSAQLRCDSIFASASNLSAKKSGRAQQSFFEPSSQRFPKNRKSTAFLKISSFAGLRDRLSDAVSIQEKFDVVLSQREKIIILNEFSKILGESKGKLDQILAFHATIEVGPYDFPFIDHLTRWQRELVQSTTSVDPPMTYQGMISLMSDLLKFAHLIEREAAWIEKPIHADPYWRRRATPEGRDFSLDIVLNRRLRRTLEQGFVLVPTTIELSVYDFNALVGTAIAPVGLSSRSVQVDGSELDPHSFFVHDVEHADRWMPSKLSLKTRASWKRLLKQIDLAPRSQREAMHVLLFFLSHERDALKGGVDFKKLKTELNLIQFESIEPGIQPYRQIGLVERLQLEQYWGATSLSQVKNLQRHLLEAKEQIIEMASDFF